MTLKAWRGNGQVLRLHPEASQRVGEENPISGDREGLFHDSLHVDLHYLPLLSSAVNKGASLGDRFVTIHVKISLFTGWIAVVPKH